MLLPSSGDKMNNKQAQELIKLANDLDRIGRKDLADRVDSILKEARTAGIVKALRILLAEHLDSKGIEHNLDRESDKWGRDLQSAWEAWTTNIGRPDIGTDWQGKAKEYGYTPNVQGMWEFIGDYKGEGYVGRGGLSGEGIEKAVPKHYYDSYMRAAEPQRAAIRADDNWWTTIQEFAQTNNKALPSGNPDVEIESMQAGRIDEEGVLFTESEDDLPPGMTSESARFNSIKKTASNISDLFSNGDVSSVGR